MLRVVLDASIIGIFFMIFSPMEPWYKILILGIIPIISLISIFRRPKKTYAHSYMDGNIIRPPVVGDTSSFFYVDKKTHKKLS